MNKISMGTGRLFVSFAAVFLLQSSFAQQRLSLRQAVETGISNNFDIAQSKILMKREGINRNQSKAMMLPDLNAFANHGFNQGRSIDPFTNQFVNQNVSFANYGAGANLILFNGGSLQNRVKADRLSFEASQEELQQTKDNLTINIILAYLQILSAQDVLEQSRQQVLVSRRQVERLQILNNAGAITPSELYDMEGQLANDQVAVSDNDAAVQSAKIDLCQLINIPYNRNLEIEKIDVDSAETNMPGSPEDIYHSSVATFAAVRATELREESTGRSIRSLRGTLFPTLSLGGNINTNYSNAATQSVFQNDKQVVSSDFVTVGGLEYPVTKNQQEYVIKNIPFDRQLSNNLFSTVSLNLSIPLFNANRVKNNIRLAKLDQQMAQVTEKRTKSVLQQTIEKNYVEMVAAKSKVDILNDQVKAFSESFRSASVRFESGVINSVDFIIAKNNLDRSSNNLITSKYNFVLRKMVLAYLSGERLW